MAIREPLISRRSVKEWSLPFATLIFSCHVWDVLLWPCCPRLLCKEYRQIVSCIICYVSISQQSLITGSCEVYIGFPKEKLSSQLQLGWGLHVFPFLLLWDQINVHWASYCLVSLFFKFHAVLLPSKFKIDTFPLVHLRGGLLHSHSILNSLSEQDTSLKRYQKYYNRSQLQYSSWCVFVSLDL